MIKKNSIFVWSFLLLLASVESFAVRVLVEVKNENTNEIKVYDASDGLTKLVSMKSISCQIVGKEKKLNGTTVRSVIFSCNGNEKNKVASYWTCSPNNVGDIQLFSVSEEQSEKDYSIDIKCEK